MLRQTDGRSVCFPDGGQTPRPDQTTCVFWLLGEKPSTLCFPRSPSVHGHPASGPGSRTAAKPQPAGGCVLPTGLSQPQKRPLLGACWQRVVSHCPPHQLGKDHGEHTRVTSVRGPRLARAVSSSRLLPRPTRAALNSTQGCVRRKACAHSYKHVIHFRWSFLLYLP